MDSLESSNQLTTIREEKDQNDSGRVSDGTAFRDLCDMIIPFIFQMAIEHGSRMTLQGRAVATKELQYSYLKASMEERLPTYLSLTLPFYDICAKGPARSLTSFLDINNLTYGQWTT